MSESEILDAIARCRHAADKTLEHEAMERTASIPRDVGHFLAEMKDVAQQLREGAGKLEAFAKSCGIDTTPLHLFACVQARENWPGAEVCLVKLELAAKDGQMGGGKGKRSAGRRHRQQQPKEKLTAKQLQAYQAYGECKGNMVQTAKRLGLSRTAAKDRVEAAYRKLGRQVPTKAATQRLLSDRRGGENIAWGDAPEHAGDGKGGGQYDRREE